MVLEGLGQSLKDALKKVVNSSNVDEKLIKEVSKDIQRALLQADVNVKLVLEITKEVERRALTEKPPAGKSAREHVVKIIADELVKILGEQRSLPIGKQVIMMVGLYGQGKTTSSGKLGRYFHKKGMKVGLIAADVHRPAAYDQLKQIGDKVGISVFGMPGETLRRQDSQRWHEGVPLHGPSSLSIRPEGMPWRGGPHRGDQGRGRCGENRTSAYWWLDASGGGSRQGRRRRRSMMAVGVTSVHTHQDGRYRERRRGPSAPYPAPRPPIVFIGVGEHLEGPWTRSSPSRFISRLLGNGRSAIPDRDRPGRCHRRAGHGDDQEDHVREVLPQRDVRADGDANQHGPAQEIDVHAARDGGLGLQDKINVEESARTSEALQDHHGLHDRGGDGETPSSSSPPA